jgi:hypothetical protein
MEKPRNTIRKKAAEKARRKRSFKAFNTLNRKMHVGSSLHSILDGSFLARENIVKQVPFILYLTLLGIFYIANSYNAEKTIIDINRTKKELEELRFNYITTKSNLMFYSKQSEVANRLKNSGLKESVVPPHKIHVKKEK